MDRAREKITPIKSCKHVRLLDISLFKYEFLRSAFTVSIEIRAPKHNMLTL